MKNNYLFLALILLIISAKGKNDNRITNILSSISVQDVLSLLKLLGVNENIIDGITDMLPEIVKSKPDIMALIKKALPIILSLSSGLTNNATDNEIIKEESFCDSPPTADFIPDEIKKDLSDYFY